MAGMDGCPCGCWQSQEARELAVKVAAEHQADLARYRAVFEEFCDARPAKPPLPADYEVSPRTRLAVLGSRDGWPPLTVRRVT